MYIYTIVLAYSKSFSLPELAVTSQTRRRWYTDHLFMWNTSNKYNVHLNNLTAARHNMSCCSSTYTTLLLYSTATHASTMNHFQTNFCIWKAKFHSTMNCELSIARIFMMHITKALTLDITDHGQILFPSNISLLPYLQEYTNIANMLGYIDFMCQHFLVLLIHTLHPIHLLLFHGSQL